MNPTLPNWETLRLVMPEIWLVIGMCAVILVPFVRRGSAGLPAVTAVVSLAFALVSVCLSLNESGRYVFHNSLAIDPFSQFFKVLLILFTGLVIAQWWIAGRRDGSSGASSAVDTPDFLCLLLGAATGMSLMASASNLVTIFIAMETASLSSFALAGFRKRGKVGTEGALKFVIFGTASSAIMVYGMSLVYGTTGSTDLATIASRAAASGVSPLLAIGLTAMFAGFAFKLSAVPLHFWCPDVFQGAPTEVTTFLSVASKGAAICLVVRVLMLFGSAAAAVPGGTGFAGMAAGVAILGAITATWGNLVAIHQTNIKRLLAYSSIAHAGYMLMAASLLIWAQSPAAGQTGLTPGGVAGAILFYLLIYLFMNMGAFTVAAIVADKTGSEELADYAGLFRRSPALAVMMTVFLLSLFGMPGLGGFWGKVYLMTSMAKAGGAGFALIAVLLINTLLSLYFYVKPVYYMAFKGGDAADGPAPAVAPQLAGLALLVFCLLGVMWTGLLPDMGGSLARDYAAVLTVADAPRVAAADGPAVTPQPPVAEVVTR